MIANVRRLEIVMAAPVSARSPERLSGFTCDAIRFMRPKSHKAAKADADQGNDGCEARRALRLRAARQCGRRALDAARGRGARHRRLAPRAEPRARRDARL